MKQLIMTVISNKAVGSDVYEIKLSGETSLKSGQFVELQLKDHYLRRPFSVTEFKDGVLTILYKIVGVGTADMTGLKEGDTIDVLSELGNTFSIEGVEKPLLVGGGIGTAPMYNLALDFHKKGIRPTVILGFRNKEEVYYIEKFQQIANVIIATDDGSLGEKGNAVSVLKNKNIDFDKYFACGPMVMLKALKEFSTNGELSLEARMGCGFGACMGCSIETTKGVKRVCKEGPVFLASEVIF